MHVNLHARISTVACSSVHCPEIHILKKVELHGAFKKYEF